MHAGCRRIRGAGQVWDEMGCDIGRVAGVRAGRCWVGMKVDWCEIKKKRKGNNVRETRRNEGRHDRTRERGKIRKGKGKLVGKRSVVYLSNRWMTASQ